MSWKTLFIIRRRNVAMTWLLFIKVKAEATTPAITCISPQELGVVFFSSRSIRTSKSVCANDWYHFLVGGEQELKYTKELVCVCVCGYQWFAVYCVVSGRTDVALLKIYRRERKGSASCNNNGTRKQHAAEQIYSTREKKKGFFLELLSPCWQSHTPYSIRARVSFTDSSKITFQVRDFLLAMDQVRSNIQLKIVLI